MCSKRSEDEDDDKYTCWIKENLFLIIHAFCICRRENNYGGALGKGGEKE